MLRKQRLDRGRSTASGRSSDFRTVILRRLGTCTLVFMIVCLHSLTSVVVQYGQTALNWYCYKCRYVTEGVFRAWGQRRAAGFVSVDRVCTAAAVCSDRSWLGTRGPANPGCRSFVATHFIICAAITRGSRPRVWRHTSAFTRLPPLRGTW